jgi:hypothetical protein
VTSTLLIAVLVFITTIVVTAWILTVWMNFIKSKNNIKSEPLEYRKTNTFSHPEIIDVEVEVLKPNRDNYYIQKSTKKRYY